MSSIPSNIGRVPNVLSSQILLANITRSNVDMLRVQAQMATGLEIIRPSDDAVRATAISVLDDRLERTDQRMRNLSAAEATLAFLDSAISEAGDMVLEATAIASGQIGVTSDAETRATESLVINAMIRELFILSNSEINGLHVFGGSTPTQRPVEEMYGGYRYVGQGAGLITDLDVGEQIPITIGGNNAIGEASARLRSTRDLDPSLTLDTRISDLAGAHNLGVSQGRLAFSVGNLPAAEIDFSDADTVGDVVDLLTSAIEDYEQVHQVTVLGAGGVSVSGSGLSIDIAPAVAATGLTFEDIGAGVTARDLGLIDATFGAAASIGADLNPRLTMLTPLSAISALTMPLDGIRIRFGDGAETAAMFDIDLSQAETAGDLKSIIESTAPGVRVRINASGTAIDIFNEVSGPRMSILELGDGADTATELGIRSLNLETRLDGFNDGRGVGIVTGAFDPVTGDPDPDRDVDFAITLGSGDSFTVNLRPVDTVNVQSIIDRINAEAAAAVARGDIPAGSISAGLTDGDNGLALFDDAGLGEITVARQNNSPAALDLGLIDGTWDAGSATFVAQDRAQIGVDNLFTALIDLREALVADDSSGIAVAAAGLESNVDRLSGARAMVGVFANRVELATRRLEDVTVLDETMRSELRDLDYAGAAIRFNLLQTQLSAALSTASQSRSQSLLNFLG